MNSQVRQIFTVAAPAVSQDAQSSSDDTAVANDAREMAGQVFMQIRTFRCGGQRPLSGPSRSFEVGLKLCLIMDGSVSHKDIAKDHGYTGTWVSDIQRRLAVGEGITKETVIMLRESIPALHYQMSLGKVLWPELAPFVDYAWKRSGVQTADRIEVQRFRRGL